MTERRVEALVVRTRMVFAVCSQTIRPRTTCRWIMRLSATRKSFIGVGYSMLMSSPENDLSTGLLISMEYPTPMNDFLVALNRIIHLVFFEDGWYVSKLKTIRVLTTNASTLRSVMGLSKTGRKNKAENIL